MELPRAAAWKAAWGGTPTLFDFLAREGGATMALAFASLFWPEFIDVRGCVVMAERYDPENFEEWWTKLRGRCPDIEATINHVHLLDVFDPDAEGVPPEAFRALAEVLRSTWQAAIEAQFPERSFEVLLTDEPEDYGPTLIVRSQAPAQT